ncbi:MAG: hypothetical protein KAV41_00695 [Candidatus Pacebacteria bacterium]|nr:hypothetical protein [Candidatus Paceibacterota bacterium]
MAKKKKPKFRKKQLNLLAIQINAENVVREQMPWLLEPKIPHDEEEDPFRGHAKGSRKCSK